MTRIPRRFAGLACGLAVGLLLVGCSGSGSTPVGTVSTTPVGTSSAAPAVGRSAAASTSAAASAGVDAIVAMTIASLSLLIESDVLNDAAWESSCRKQSTDDAVELGSTLISTYVQPVLSLYDTTETADFDGLPTAGDAEKVGSTIITWLCASGTMPEPVSPADREDALKTFAIWMARAQYQGTSVGCIALVNGSSIVETGEALGLDHDTSAVIGVEVLRDHC